VVFLKPLVTDPRIEVGEYTYYDDPDDALAFEERAFLYAHGPERLIIGRYCALASGVRFVMPGVTIGDGAIVAAASVVVSHIPPYAIAGGNPARVIRQRYDDEDLERLLRAAWWDWPAELVTEHARTIMSGTPAELERIALAHRPA
jgi:virginiamycin A acetyltransferase